MAKRKTNPDFLNGVPDLLLLRLLSEKPMYGYELVQAIRQASDGQLNFGEGCIYPLLHRLEKDKLLVSRREMVAGRKRLVYRTTKAGVGQLKKTASDWRLVVCAVEKILHGGSEHGGRLAGSVA
jgi:PadR family transcriptional regulator PadR